MTWRIVWFALIVVAGVAWPVRAEDAADGLTTRGIGQARQHAIASTGRSEVLREQTGTHLQVGGALAIAGSARVTRAARDGDERGAKLAGSPAEGQGRQSASALPWLRQDRPGWAVPVTERFFLVVGYRHLRAEDLRVRAAKTGAVDYDSHDFLVRAHWLF